MAPSFLGKRRVAALDDEDETAVPSPRSTKRLRNLRIHEEADEGDGPTANIRESCLSLRKTPRSTRTKLNSLKAGVQAIIDIDGVNTDRPSVAVLDENRDPQPRPEPEYNENSAGLEEPPHVISNPRTEFATPHKSRFRDALASSQPAQSPSTPRHRIIVGSRPLTPRTPRTPRALSLAAGPAITSTVYTPAKQLFARNASPGQLVGRENERDELKSIISNALGVFKGSCVYVSGPPGTGKSAVVGGLLGEFDMADYLKDKDVQKEYQNVKTASINCASMTIAKDIYRRLLDELSPEGAEKQVFKKSEVDILRGMFVTRSKKNATFYIVTLDEIDHLLSTSSAGNNHNTKSSDDSSVLSTLFEWSLSPSSRLLLVGVANALDLTDRFLPRLKSKNLKPILLPFMPYTPAQIGKIITSKLRSLMPKANDKASTNANETEHVPADFTPFLHPAAIQLCARKVASTTGDLRKAFELVRRTIDLVEKETMQKRHTATQAAGLATVNSTISSSVAVEPQSPSHRKMTVNGKTPLFENANLASRVTPPDTPGASQDKKFASPAGSTLPALTPANAPRATVAHVARVTSSLFNNRTSDRLASLNLQQKAALCALVAINRKARSGEVGDGDKENVATTPRTPSKRSASVFAVDQPTIKRVFAIYVSLCRRDNTLTPLSASEFNDVISSLETSGLVGLVNSSTGSVTPSRTPSRRSRVERGETTIKCFIGENEVLDALKGVGEGVLKKLVSGIE
ncbi:AAA ATPase [Ascosphaera aggregata]|nr:AAA ATPase [Ascosphaera aggregata]